MPFFGLLAAGYIEKNSEHRASDNTGVFALASGGDPPYFVANHYSKVSLVRPEHATRRGKCGTNTITIRWMNMGGELFEANRTLPRQTPQLEPAFVHCELIGVHVPRPKRDASCGNREAKPFGRPRLWINEFCAQDTYTPNSRSRTDVARAPDARAPLVVFRSLWRS